MSYEGDTFWVSLWERLFGIVIIIIGAILLYYTAITSDIGGFGALFGFLSAILLIVGVVLLILKPPQ